MKFQDTTNKYNGIIQRFEMMTGQGDTAVSGTAYLLQEAVALANDAVNKVETWLREVDKKWRFDDDNYSDFPMATTNLFANQRDYSNPFAKIIKLEIMDNAGNYHNLTFNPERLKEEGRWQEEAGLPSEYYFLAGQIILYPKPATASVTLTKGLRATYERQGDLFTAADTTQEPGFLDSYHILIPALMTLSWTENKPDLGDLYNKTYSKIYGSNAEKGLKKELQRAYSQPTEDYKPKLGMNFSRRMVK